MSYTINKFRRCFIQMAVEDRVEKNYNYGGYFERNGHCIIKKITIVCKSPNPQVFN